MYIYIYIRMHIDMNLLVHVWTAHVHAVATATKSLGIRGFRQGAPEILQELRNRIVAAEAVVGRAEGGFCI